jgi:hypothetical protein
MDIEQEEILTTEEIEAWVEKTFEENYERLRLDGGHALTPYVRKMALEQIKGYYNKLRDVAENVTDTEVRLTLPEQHTPEGRKFTIEGVVDIVRENDLTIMYDIKTHDADYVRKNPENYEEQLNVYAHIWQTLRGEPLDQTAIIATAFPDAVKDALRKKNDVAIKKQMDLWNPLIDIPLKQEKVQDTINGFGATVDCIESKKFKPPRVEVLQEEVGTTRQKFGTRVCRNCDARFSCTSYRNFVISTNARTGIDFRTYFTDFGSDDEKAETVSLTLEVAPPRDVEIETKEDL